MTESEIRKIVRMTITEYTTIKDFKSISEQLERRIINAFKTYDAKISDILGELADDPYINIIYYIYRDKRSAEYTAERMNKDVSTIRRNKKRLLIKIYELLEG